MSTDKKHRWAQMKAITAITLLINICAAGFCFAEEETFTPQRIISLGPGLTEQLYLLGVRNRVVGVTTYCTRPPGAQEKEKIGTILEVDIEKVVSLEPDLVLATPLTSPRAVKKLEDLGINVVSFPLAKDFSQVCAQFQELGRLVGREQQAQEIVRQAEQEVELLKKKIQGLPKPKVFVQIGARPLYAATEDYFIHDFIESAGGINVAAGLKSGLFSREKVLETNPDVIIIATMGMVGEQERKTWEKYETLEAVKNKKIYIVDPDKFCSPTPASFVQALEEMVEILHP